MKRYLFTFSLILLAALSRLLPHLPNFAPIAALALFGGVYLDKKHTFIVPIAAMLISDYFIGFHGGMPWVYGSFLAIGCIGLWLRKHPGVATTIGATFAGSILFFIVTNFAVWFTSHGFYPQTFTGLMECYTMAIPFFRNSLMGDFTYVTALFGVYELAKRMAPSLTLQTQK